MKFAPLTPCDNVRCRVMSSTGRIRRDLPPGPKGTLIGGNLGQIGPRRVDFFLELAQTYGPLASFRVGHWRIFLLSDPDLIQQVLITDAKHYVKHYGVRTFKPILGNGLVTSEGDFWFRQRRLLQPAFLRGRILSYAPVMAELTRAILEGWIPGQTIDIQFELSAITSAIALKTLFGIDDHGYRARVNDSLQLAFDLMAVRLDWLFQVPLWVPTPANLRLRRAIDDINRVVAEFIGAVRARSRPGDDLLSMMISAKAEDGTGMTDQQLRDEAMTIYLAGHETTALALTWCWYLLSQHPEAEQELVSEWARVLRGRLPSADDLPYMPYTAAVIYEAMRLYPPVYAIGREAVVDLELGGYRVKRGYTILMSQWVNHRDPRYFPQPEEFRPERWLTGLANRLPKFAYYPFGGGQRMCIGSHFAIVEAAIVLASIGQRFRFTLESGTVIDVNPQLTLAPKNILTAALEHR
jgi:cytochrome P450